MPKTAYNKTQILQIVTNQYHLRQSDPYRESSPRLYECIFVRQAPSMYKAARSFRGGRSGQHGSFSPSIIDALYHRYVTHLRT